MIVFVHEEHPHSAYVMISFKGLFPLISIVCSTDTGIVLKLNSTYPSI